MLKTVTGPELRTCSRAGRTISARQRRPAHLSLWTIPWLAIGLNQKLARVVQPSAVLASIPATVSFPSSSSTRQIGAARHWLHASCCWEPPMVHPLQRHRRSHVHSLRLKELPLSTTSPLATLDQADPPGISLTSSPAWSGLRRSLERLGFRRVLPRCRRILQTIGLGAQIDAATDSGRFPILLLATILISLMVVTMNRLVCAASTPRRDALTNSKVDGILFSTRLSKVHVSETTEEPAVRQA